MESESFTVEEGGTGSFSFTAELSSPGSSSASLKWHLEKLDSNGDWQQVEGVGGTVGSGTHSVDGLESGEYQAVFEAEASGRHDTAPWWAWWSNYQYPSVSAGELESEFLADPYEELSVSEFEGNVLEGATPGSINSTLSVKLPDGDWQEVGEAGLTLAGEYGTLVIQKDGSYVYTPEANADFVGKSEAFEIQLTHPAGESVTATLTIDIGGNAQPAGDQGGEIQATGFGLFSLEDLDALSGEEDAAASDESEDAVEDDEVEPEPTDEDDTESESKDEDEGDEKEGEEGANEPVIEGEDAIDEPENENADSAQDDEAGTAPEDATEDDEGDSYSSDEEEQVAESGSVDKDDKDERAEEDEKEDGIKLQDVVSDDDELLKDDDSSMDKMPKSVNGGDDPSVGYSSGPDELDTTTNTTDQ